MTGFVDQHAVTLDALPPPRHPFQQPLAELDIDRPPGRQVFGAVDLRRLAEKIAVPPKRIS
ncbi:hypothetical protein [Streptomyces marispadix]|uniref:hypothetical protein n=1 Tax=Streptomyces marispadix TaxID=2922868 RepID=UPI001F1438B8|nr:hypothetical protein [Streptomyces marispadix]